MDGNKSQPAQQNTCQCRCPCHYRNTEINETQTSSHAITKISKQPSRTAQITISETIQIQNETDSDASNPYNPFHGTGAGPAAAAFSKSFLHVKNIVKNMTARWESLAEPEDEDTSNKPRRYSLTARCVGSHCANPENIELDWKRVPSKTGDQKEYHWKHKDAVPENIEQHEYSLAPLQSNRNVSAFNKDSPSATASNHQTFQTQTPTLQVPENSFQQDNVRFVDTVSKNPSQNMIPSAKESSNQTALSIRSIPISPQPEQARSFHSTNPFNPTDSQSEQRFQQNKNESGEIFFKNEFNMEAPAIAPPQSVKSEVKNIRKSFEQEVDEIVEKVNRTNIDSHQPTNDSSTMAGPSWLHETPFTDELKVSQSKVDDIIAKSERVKDSDSKANIGSASAIKSKEVQKNNIGDDNRTGIYSFPVARAETAQSQMIGVGPKNSSYNKKDGNDDLGKSDVKAVKTTLSLDWDTASLRRKSLDDYLPVSSGDKTGGGSRPDREVAGSKRLSAPTYITSQSQLAKNNLRTMAYDGRTKKDAAGVNRSTQSVVSQTAINDAAIQTSKSMFEICKAFQTRVPSGIVSSLDPTNSKAVLRQPQTKVSAHNEIKSNCKLNLESSKEDRNCYTKDTLANKMKEKASNESIMAVQKKENELLDGTNYKDDNTPLEMMARIATANDEQDYATYMAWISVQSGGGKSFGARSEEYQEDCHIDPNANEYLVYNEMNEETSADSDEDEEEDKEKILNSLSREYDDVVATPSQLLVEPIGQSISVSNTSIEMQNRCSGDRIHRDHLKERLSSSQMTASTKSQGSNDMDKESSTSSRTKIQRSKREFYKCHKCHKIVASGEAAFYSNDEVDIAWHPRCFTCIECDKDLSQSDHSFFDEEPYCREHYVRVANIPKCSKCQELIYDPTYTSAAGNSWHQQHFSCQACKKPLVDAEYVFVRNKHPYCFQCHEKHFQKICNTCDGPIPPSMPFVQGGNAFWHSNTKCMHCSSCNGSLVGRSLFFRRGRKLFCNRYCALREM